MSTLLVRVVSRGLYMVMGMLLAMVVIMSPSGIPKVEMNGGDEETPFVLEADRDYMLSLMLVRADELQFGEQPVISFRAFPISAGLFALNDEAETTSSITLDLEAAPGLDVLVSDQDNSLVGLVPVFSIRLTEDGTSPDHCAPDQRSESPYEMAI